MRVQVNGEVRELPEGVNLRKMLELFSLPQQRVAIELNSRVIRRAEWDTTEIASDDRLEIIHFVGGG